MIGANDNEGSVGHILIKNLTQQGYNGEVYPINIHKDEILGIRARAHAIYAKMFSDDNRNIELMKDKGFVLENLKDDSVKAFLEI
jgi:ATP-dependent protease ClpP protease subunit